MSSSLELKVSVSEALVCGMSRLVYESVEKAVRHCGSVHNFDAELMLRSMNLSVELSSKKEKVVKEKVVKEKVVKSKIPLPFSGSLKVGCCQALRQNHGLYTQCETAVNSDEMFCKKCGDNPECGTIQERLAVGIMEFRDKKGKAPTAYMKVLNKLKISREQAEEEAGKLNIIIDDIHFQEENGAKKEKGRPKKAKKIIELEDDSTDLFAELVSKANEVDFGSDEEESNDEKASVAVAVTETVLDKVDETVENNEKKAEKQKKDAEKQAEKEKKDAEKAEKEAAKLAEKQKKDAEKAEKAPAKSKKEASSDSEKDKKKSKEPEKKTTKKVEEDEDEEDVVKRFEFEGVKYLKSKKTGIIYNMDQDVIGKWNEKTGKIDFQVQDSEEEEEEYDE
jgi:chemotaxis protein histidine kinase CheA